MKNIFGSLLLLSIVFLSVGAGMFMPAFGQHRKAVLVRTIDSILNTEVKADSIPGAVIQICQDGKVICRRAFGYARKYDYGKKLMQVPEKMTTEHLFDIASLTKVVGTTTAIMLLVDRGLIKVDDPVGKFVPAFNSPDKKGITIRHLLTHSSGLYEWYPLYYRSSDKAATFKLIGELPLAFPVGKGRHYSDLGFTVLGEIIEKVSGQSLDRFVQENIFSPLHMDHTVYNPNVSGHFDKIASTSHGNPYERRMVYDSSLGFKFKEIDPLQWNGWREYTLRGEVNDGNAWYANKGVSGAAGLFSTVDDLQVLVNLLMKEGMGEGKPFISRATIDLFLTRDGFKNGLGWMMDSTNSFMRSAPAGSFGHTGFTGTSIVAIPEWNISVILLINRQNRGLLADGHYYDVAGIRHQIFNAILRYAR